MLCTLDDAVNSGYMEMKILEEVENKLLDRKEIKFSVKHDKAATPKKQDLIKEIAAKYSVAEENVVIDYIFTKKGTNESDIKVKIYEEKPKIKVKKTEKKEIAKAEEKK